jgi:uncharacterized protein (TIGR03435 family)
LTCQTLATLIRQAYVVFAGVRRGAPGFDVPIVGGPDWLDSDGYLIAAKAGSEQPRAMLLGPMFQRLLEERFMLKVHLETRELPAYALTVAGGGFKLRPIDPATCAARDATAPPVLTARDPVTQKPFCQMIISGGSGLRGSMTVQELSNALSSYVDRQIINKTGIDGIFNVDVQFVPLRVPGPLGRPPDPAAGGGVSIFTAIEEQLGLRLERTTGPSPVIVIDRVERPSPN